MGLPAYVLIKVLQAGYFARENTKSPMKIALVTVSVNVVASLSLFPVFSFVGIAIATSIAGWVNVALLVHGLRGSLGLGPKRRKQLASTFFAAAAMGAVVYGANLALAPWFDGALWQRIVSMLLLVGVGGTAYALLAMALKATSVAELKAGFRR